MNSLYHRIPLFPAGTERSGSRKARRFSPPHIDVAVRSEEVRFAPPQSWLPALKRRPDRVGVFEMALRLHHSA